MGWAPDTAIILPFSTVCCVSVRVMKKPSALCGMPGEPQRHLQVWQVANSKLEEVGVKKDENSLVASDKVVCTTWKTRRAPVPSASVLGSKLPTNL